MASAFHPLESPKSTFHKYFPRDAIKIDGSRAPGRDMPTDIKSREEMEYRDESDPDETEDEEVKVNCFGVVNIYIASSSEEYSEDDDSTSSYEESEERLLNRHEDQVPPIITCHIPQNIIIHRPRPILGVMVDGGGMDCNASKDQDIRRPLHLNNYRHCVNYEDDADDEESKQENCTDDGTYQLTSGNSDSENDTEKYDNSTFTALPCNSEDSCSKNSTSVYSEISLCLSTEKTELILPWNPSIVFDEMSHKAEYIDEVPAIKTAEIPHSPFPSTLKRKNSSILTSDEERTEQNSKHLKHNKSDQPMVKLLPELLLRLPAQCTSGIIEHRDSSVSPYSISRYNSDSQLIEDLIDTCINDERKNTSVPVLSPPSLPLCVEGGQGQPTTLCEWPSNFTVDDAWTMATGVPAHSPASLLKMKEDADDRILSYYLSLETGTKHKPFETIRNCFGIAQKYSGKLG